MMMPSTVTEAKAPYVPGTMFKKDTSTDVIKVRTMYKMVEDVRISVGGRSLERKLLYLTNSQAENITAKNIDKCISALELKNPRCLIRLMFSMGSGQAYRVHTELHKEVPWEQWTKSLGGPNGSDINALDEAVTEAKLALFMQECILPLARDTNALIICSGADECALSSVLGNVVAADQARFGEHCRYTVLCTVNLIDIYAKASTGKGSVAHQLVHGEKYSARWHARWGDCDDALSKLSVLHQQCDITGGASRIIVFEGLKINAKKIESDMENSKYEGLKVGVGEHVTVDVSHQNTFESMLIAALQKHLPAIAIQTMGMPHMAKVVDPIKNGVPVLFLDTRERAITSVIGDSEVPITSLAKNATSFPVVAERFADGAWSSVFKVGNGVDIEKITFEHGKGVDEYTREMFLEAAFTVLRTEAEQLSKAGVVDGYNSGQLALLHRALKFGTWADYDDRNIGKVPLYQRVVELKRLAEMDSKDLKIPEHLIEKALFQFRVTSKVATLNQRIKQIEKYIKEIEVKKEPLADTRILEAREKIKSLEGSIKEAAADLSSEEYASLRLIMTSDLAFSSSIFDLRDCNKKIREAVKVERLPTANSFEAIKIIQSAWDWIELYHHEADGYKVAAKVTFAILLIAGCVVASVTFVPSNWIKEPFSQSNVILGTSLVVSAVTAYQGVKSPSQRWQRLRAAALAMESELWKFRTRTGAYHVTSNFQDRMAKDRLLRTNVSLIKASVLEGAGVAGSGFYGLRRTLNLHGQHEVGAEGFGLDNPAHIDRTPVLLRGRLFRPINSSSSLKLDVPWVDIAALDANNDGKITLGEAMTGIKKKLEGIASQASATNDPLQDTHYAPLKPDLYLAYRVRMAREFYKLRLPQKNRAQHAGQFALAAGSIAGVLLVLFDLAPFAAIVSIVGSSVAAWLDFTAVNAKMTRYSTCVDGLTDLEAWWDSLRPMERAMAENAERLVATGEGIIRSEQGSWAAMAARATKTAGAKNDAQGEAAGEP